MTSLTCGRRILQTLPILLVLPLLASAEGTHEANLASSAIRLQVDATDSSHRILKITEQIPISNSGELTLYFPKWIPGTHAPSGPIDDLSGLEVAANGKRLQWRRDPVDMNAFRVTAPAGANKLDVQFQLLCSEATPSAMTSQMAEIEWNTVSLYPAGVPLTRLLVDPSLLLPTGWKYGTALETRDFSASTANFRTTTYSKLVDSPVLAGKNFRQIELAGAGNGPIRLNIASDHKKDLEIKPFQIDELNQLVRQTDRLFGSRHYDHYDFLLSISDELKFRGLEHAESSDDGTKTGFFEGWDKDGSIYNQLMPHEYVHSWNGKYRRPLDLATSDYATPMQNSLLWVYEGLTEYWGYVLAARAGLQSPEYAKESLALKVAFVDSQHGRQWRDLQDTTNTEILTNGRTRPLKWHSWQRGLDYYSEGSLIWLDADAIIRQRSKGKRSLDDFAFSFFGKQHDEKTVPFTYDLGELVQALNEIEPFDWREYFETRLTSHDLPPLEGLVKSGYRLVFTDKKADLQEKSWKAWAKDDFYFSLGVSIDKDGKLADIVWDSPAFEAGLSSGNIIVAVNGESYTAETLSNALVDAKTGKPLDVLVKTEDHYRTIALNYRNGPRFPHLEKIVATPLLDKIFAPR